MSSNHHNWNQFHKVLTNNLGWRQVISYGRDMISYISPSGKHLVIKKSNKMSIDYTMMVLIQIGLDYVAFIRYYDDGHL